MAVGTHYGYKDVNGIVMEDASDLVHSYNTDTNVWAQLKSMNKSRLGHSLALFKGLICAVGGSEFSSAECYNATTNHWTNLPVMTMVRRYSAAVELNNELYVMGGSFAVSHRSVQTSDPAPEYSRNYFDTVEKYNPVKKHWTKVASLIEGRKNHVAGVFNGKIYVVGGVSSIVEAYDSMENIWKNCSLISPSPLHTTFLPLFSSAASFVND